MVFVQLWLQNVDEKKTETCTKSTTHSRIYKIVSLSAVLSAILTSLLLLSQCHSSSFHPSRSLHIFDNGIDSVSQNVHNIFAHSTNIEQKKQANNDNNNNNDNNDNGDNDNNNNKNENESEDETEYNDTSGYKDASGFGYNKHTPSESSERYAKEGKPFETETKPTETKREMNERPAFYSTEKPPF